MINHSHCFDACRLYPLDTITPPPLSHGKPIPTLGNSLFLLSCHSNPNRCYSLLCMYRSQQRKLISRSRSSSSPRSSCKIYKGYIEHHSNPQAIVRNHLLTHHTSLLLCRYSTRCSGNHIPSASRIIYLVGAITNQASQGIKSDPKT